MDLFAAGVPWFPQDHAATYYTIKGFVALAATVLCVFHMSEALREAMTIGRQLRYYALLGAAILLTSSSVEQVSEGVVVSYRNLGGFVLALLILVAMVVSIAESRRRD